MRGLKIVTLAIVLALALGASVGCAKKAPQLTPEQLQAGVIGGEKHPVDQQEATNQGCACHLAAQ